MNKGVFIVFEGVDGAGKSTQIQLLKGRLIDLGFSVHVTHEPTDRPIGRLIRRILKNEISYSEEILAQLYAIDRQDHILHTKEGMDRLLKEGKIVICDRYYWSSLAYHSLYLPMEQVYEMNKKNVSLLQPDITMFLDLDIEESMERLKNRGGDKEKFDNHSLQLRIRENFFEAFRKYGSNQTIVNIDARHSKLDIHNRIWSAVSEFMSS